MVWERIVVVDIATRSGMTNYSGFVIFNLLNLNGAHSISIKVHIDI